MKPLPNQSGRLSVENCAVEASCKRNLHCRTFEGSEARPVFRLWLAASILVGTVSAQAQDALRSALATQAAIEARSAQPAERPYSFKKGDFRLLVMPSLSLEWNDNINVVKSDALQDFIIRPMLQLDASYPITTANLLSVNIGVGYDKYTQHDRYSTWRLQSGSGLAFDLQIKNLAINLHDRAQYLQDSSQRSEISGTARYATINNTAGLLATLDLNDMILSAGYDHENVISESSQFRFQDRATDSVLARAGFKVHPRVTAGLEATAAFTAYDQRVLNDNDAYSVGAYADWAPGSYLRIQPRAGYSIYQFQHTSQSIQTASVNSWYADLNISHRITDAINYSIDAGHEVRLGIQSDATDDWYVRPGVNWNVVRDLNLHTSFSYERGKLGRGNVFGNLVENYDWFTASVGATYPIMKKLSASLNYRMTLRSSGLASREYTQNLVELQVSYRP